MASVLVVNMISFWGTKCYYIYFVFSWKKSGYLSNLWIICGA